MGERGVSSTSGLVAFSAMLSNADVDSEVYRGPSRQAKLSDHLAEGMLQGCVRDSLGDGCGD